MAIEPRRLCHYRTVGSLYLVCPPYFWTCDRQFILETCTVCGGGIKHSRGFKWFEPGKLMGQHMIDDEPCPDVKLRCLLCSPPEGQHGLMWIGDKFYSVESFLQEAGEMGISRKIRSIPRKFKLGKTVVYLAHVKAFTDPEDEKKKLPGIFCAFRPKRLERIITQSQSEDDEFMEKLKNRGETPVIVPNEDKDHQQTRRNKDDDDDREPLEQGDMQVLQPGSTLDREDGSVEEGHLYAAMQRGGDSSN